MVINRITRIVPYLKVKSLQLIWRSGTRRFHLRVPDLQMSCNDLTTRQRVLGLWPQWWLPWATWAILFCFCLELLSRVFASQLVQYSIRMEEWPQQTCSCFWQRAWRWRLLAPSHQHLWQSSQIILMCVARSNVYYRSLTHGMNTINHLISKSSVS